MRVTGGTATVEVAREGSFGDMETLLIECGGYARRITCELKGFISLRTSLTINDLNYLNFYLK